MIKKHNISETASRINGYWQPAIIGEVNDHHVKLAKIRDEFIWHKHDHEDEMFLVISGSLIMHMRQEAIVINPGEFIVIPKGVEHKPEAKVETVIMLFEPKATINTGDQNESERTVKDLKRL